MFERNAIWWNGFALLLQFQLFIYIIMLIGSAENDQSIFSNKAIHYSQGCLFDKIESIGLGGPSSQFGPPGRIPLSLTITKWWFFPSTLASLFVGQEHLNAKTWLTHISLDLAMKPIAIMHYIWDDLASRFLFIGYRGHFVATIGTFHHGNICHYFQSCWRTIKGKVPSC